MTRTSEITPLLRHASVQEDKKWSAYQATSGPARAKSVDDADEDAVPPFSRFQKKLLAMMSLVGLLGGSLAALMYPFFPVEASGRGLSQTLISAVFSCFAATQMASYPLFGRVAPAVGVRRLYNAGLITTALTTVTFGALHFIADATAFIAACFAVRMLEAFGAAAISTCSLTMLSRCMPERASTAVGFIAAAQSVGLAVAPAIGGGLYALGGFGLPFYALGVVMLLTAAFNIFHMPATEHTSDSAGHFLSRLATLAGSCEVWVCCCVIVIYTGAFSAFASCLSPYALSALGVTPAELGLFFLVASGAYAIASVLWGRLLEPYRNPYYIMGGCLLLASCAILLIPPLPVLGLRPSGLLMGGAMLLHEVTFAGTFTPCLKLMTLAARRHRLPDGLATGALVSSVLGAAFALGTVLGPLMGGVLVDHMGFPAMMAVLASVTAAVALLVLVQGLLVSWGSRRTRKSRKEKEPKGGGDAGKGEQGAHDADKATP